jgi:hypothetical protein
MIKTLFRRRSGSPAEDGGPQSDRSTQDAIAGPVAASLQGESVPHKVSETTPEVLKEALRVLSALIVNVTVLTALLVYFGWARAESHAAELGINESILGMSTQDYVLRSVNSVFVLILSVSVTGLLWLVTEPHLRRAVRPTADNGRRWWRVVLFRLLASSWLILPLLVVLLAISERVSPPIAYILIPAAIVVGVLLWFWTRSLRSTGLPSTGRASHGMTAVFTWLLVIICAFWALTFYAEYEGKKLADGFPSDLAKQPAVVVYSTTRLHLNGPGVVEQVLPAPEGDTYRYTGLRFVEHTGGNYFLVSDGWSKEYGVFFILADDTPSTRLEFVRGGPS